MKRFAPIAVLAFMCTSPASAGEWNDVVQDVTRAAATYMVGAYVCRDALHGLARFRDAQGLAATSFVALGMTWAEARLEVKKLAIQIVRVSPRHPRSSPPRDNSDCGPLLEEEIDNFRSALLRAKAYGDAQDP
jgi:hypothetical protein